MLNENGNEVTWIVGQTGAGKTTFAKELLQSGDIHLDGDDMRLIWVDSILGWSRRDRFTQNIRIAHLAKHLLDQGFNVIVSTVAPYQDLRDKLKRITDCRFIYLTHNDYAADDKEHPFEPAFDAEIVVDRKEDVDTWKNIK